MTQEPTRYLKRLALTKHAFSVLKIAAALILLRRSTSLVIIGLCIFLLAQFILNLTRNYFLDLEQNYNVNFKKHVQARAKGESSELDSKVLKRFLLSKYCKIGLRGLSVLGIVITLSEGTPFTLLWLFVLLLAQFMINYINRFIQITVVSNWGIERVTAAANRTDLTREEFNAEADKITEETKERIDLL